MNVNEDIKKILIIRLSALGDTIHTLPAVYNLRKKFPSAKIDWIIEDKSSIFIKNNPLINNVYIIQKKDFNSYLKAIKEIRAQKYDVALDFQQLLKSAIVLGLSRAKRKIMLDGGREFSFLFANEIIKTNRKLFCKNYHVVKRNIDLVKSVGVDTEEIKFILPDFSKNTNIEIENEINKLDKSKKIMVISPSTTWVNKHWQINSWREIINKYKDKYNIVLTGGKNDKEYTNKILEGIKSENIVDLTGRTEIADLIYINQKADIIISPDSGSANIAWASNIKSIIALFFATSAKRTSPFGENYYSLSAKAECAPCMKKKCTLWVSKNKCTSSISTKEVEKLIEQIESTKI